MDALGRIDLFSPKGLAVKNGPFPYDDFLGLLSSFFKTWKFSDHHLPNSLKARKIPGKEDLPEYCLLKFRLLFSYYYRDDGLALWEAIECYVSDILNVYYKSDHDVVEDQEVQNWAHEIATTGYLRDGRFPEKVHSIAHLTELITIFIFTATLHHSVVNFAQFESTSFVPLTPGALFERPPG